MSTRINIKADNLIWAITRAGHELSEFLRDTPLVQQWIKKEKQPTVKQLEKFSKQVHVPFGYLLLDSPPTETLPIPFFRSQNTDQKSISLNVVDTVRILKRRQEWLAEYLEENEAKTLPFVGSATVNDPIEKVVKRIREILELPEDWASKYRTYAEALNHFSNQLEEQRIIVTFNSVVGNNNHRKIPLEDCRGLVLVHPIVPFLFVNSTDAKSAQLFTLAHELVHIWLGESAGFDLEGWLPADDPIERFCDQAAAELLVPARLFEDRWKVDQDYKKLARKFKVSPIVVARRALDLKKIGKKAFFVFYNAYIQELNDLNLKQNQGNTGGDFYATTKKRISPTFAGYINEAVRHNELLHLEAYRLTGMKGDTYAKFIEKLMD